MNLDSTSEVKAKWVLETMGILDAPAYHLDEIAKAQKIRVEEHQSQAEDGCCLCSRFHLEQRRMRQSRAGTTNWTFPRLIPRNG